MISFNNNATRVASSKNVQTVFVVLHEIRFYYKTALFPVLLTFKIMPKRHRSIILCRIYGTEFVGPPKHSGRN